MPRCAPRTALFLSAALLCTGLGVSLAEAPPPTADPPGSSLPAGSGGGAAPAATSDAPLAEADSGQPAPTPTPLPFWRRLLSRDDDTGAPPPAGAGGDPEVLEAMGRLLRARTLWRERRAFVQRGLTPDPLPPVTEVTDPAAILGPLPRPAHHPYLTVEFQEELDILTDSSLSAGNQTQLLLNHHSWDTKKEFMDGAREHLLVTAMIMRCDEGGQEFTQHMIDAAARGVDTRFILDGLFSFYAAPCLDDMEEGGVKVALSLRSLQPWTFDWEMHEKLLIVDGEVGTIGGQNVGKWYQESNGLDRYYRDTDVLLRGPVVRQLGRRFVTLWTSLEPDDQSLAPLLTEWDTQDALDERQGLVGARHYATWLSASAPQGLCRFVAQDPHLDTFYVWTAYLAHVEAARRRVMLTAYALDPLGSPTQEALKDALVEVASRPDGRVDILTNGAGVLESDVVPSLFRRTYARSILTQAWEGLGQTPVRLWTYNHFLHAKQYYFDGVGVSIGSFNYDTSGNQCQESVVICYDPGLISAVERSFATDLANASLVSESLPQEAHP